VGDLGPYGERESEVAARSEDERATASRESETQVRVGSEDEGGRVPAEAE
jgi:hypothetical protein